MKLWSRTWVRISACVWSLFSIAAAGPRAVNELGEAVIHNGHKKSVAITEVILDDAARDAGCFGDVPGAGGAEAFYVNALGSSRR